MDLLVGIAAFVLQAIIVTATVVWQLGKVRDELKDEINTSRKELEKEADAKFDQVQRQFGETIMALREKVVQIELYIRDTYVSKNSFNTILDRILVELKAQGEKFENRCTRLETEIKTYLLDSREQP